MYVEEAGACETGREHECETGREHENETGREHESETKSIFMYLFYLFVYF